MQLSTLSLINNINVALTARHKECKAINSKLNIKLLEILIRQGYINGYSIEKIEGKEISNLRISLKYFNGQPVITLIKPISKKGKLVPISYRNIENHTTACYIISTSDVEQNLKTSTEIIEKRTGGILLCVVF